MSLAHADPAAAEARPAVTADAVLDAALTLFAERGYHAPRFGGSACGHERAWPSKKPPASRRGVSQPT